MFLRILLVWSPMILIAFANAALRETLLMKHFHEARAHQLSTVSLILLCTVYIWFILPVLKFQNAGQAILTGFIWMMLTIIFEFVLGRLSGKSWNFFCKITTWLKDGYGYCFYCSFLSCLTYSI